MAKNKPVPKKLLLSRLDAWSISHDLELDPYLASVRNAIDTSSGIDFWSTLDPEQNLPKPRAEIGSSRIRAARLVSILRNVSVFLPVGITWKAIGEATTAFAEFTSSTAVAPVNFLEFWQNGYGFLDSKWLIGNVAELDFWIIVGIVILTLLATTLQQSGKNLNRKEQELLDRERQVLVLELKSYFSIPRKVSSAGIDQSMAKALRNLTSATEAIAVAAMNLRQATKVQPEYQQIHSEVQSFYQRLGAILRASK
jgi:hypothetical protein